MPEETTRESAPIHAYQNPHLDKKKFKLSLPTERNKLIAIVFVLIAIPVTVALALTQQQFLNFASTNQIARVDINPGMISANIETPPQPVQMSTLAFDDQGNSIDSDVIYEWSISSRDEVGTLTKTDGNISQFVARKYGCGVITVIARYGDQTFTKSANVEVFSGSNHPECNTIAPTPTPFPPLVYKLNGITITNFQPVLNINPGMQERLMTITSTGATTVLLIGNAYGSGIYYTPSDFSISPGESVDVYMNVNSNVPRGNYSGTPIIRTDMGDGDINTTSVFLSVGSPNPSITPPTTTPEPTPTLTNTPTPTPLPTNTPTPTPLPGNMTVTLKPTSDAFIKSTQINKNFGTWTTMEVDNDPISIGLLKFDLKSLAGKTIVKATLTLHVSDASINTQALQRANDKSWSETTISYSTRPTSISTIRTFNAGAVGQTLSLLVTNPVNVKKGSAITFMISSAGTDRATYYSREAGSSLTPTLTVEYK